MIDLKLVDELGVLVRKGRRKQKKRVLNKVTILAAAVAFILICLLVYSSTLQSNQTANETSEPRAAIVDHLSISQPNQTFWKTSRTLLEAAGYRVSYFAGGVVTVGFYRKLPSQGFDLIIFRVHSTARGAEEDEPGDFVVFFTCEKYSQTRYLGEQLAHQLVIAGFPYDQQEYYGITPLFVQDSMKGRFKNTTIIMMGCEGLRYTSMAEAFIGRGAEVYIGWNGSVSAAHTDQATIHLLRNLVTEKQSIGQALAETMNEVGQDPTYKSILSFHPHSEENTIIHASASDTTQTNALTRKKEPNRS